MDVRIWPILLCLCTAVHSKNIIMVLVDDLDLVLDGMQPLANTRSFIGDQGATYTNCFVASPICCPNRASILTGRYQHNHHTFNNSIAGGCSSRQWQTGPERSTFATILKNKMGYETFYAGKYLNQYGSAAVGGARYVPPGWDWWMGLVGNSKYFDYTLSVNGSATKFAHLPQDYLTDVIDKHWLVRMGPSPLPAAVLPALDETYRRRWETLLAVDDLVIKVYTALKLKNLLNDTFFIFTSDNGYHIGQFSMPIDKRQPYETDIRVPLLIRGPGITPNSQVNAPVSSVDLFATILEMGGTEAESDGTSMLSKNISDDRTLLIEYRGEHSVVRQNTGCPSDQDLNLTECRSDMACKCEDSGNNTYACVRRYSKDHNNVFCIFEDTQSYVEAYDLNSDPDQLTNIGYTMKRSKRYRFRKRLKEMMVCEGAACVRTQPMARH